MEPTQLHELVKNDQSQDALEDKIFRMCVGNFEFDVWIENVGYVEDDDDEEEDYFKCNIVNRARLSDYFEGYGSTPLEALETTLYNMGIEV